VNRSGGDLELSRRWNHRFDQLKTCMPIKLMLLEIDQSSWDKLRRDYIYLRAWILRQGASISCMDLLARRNHVRIFKRIIKSLASNNGSCALRQASTSILQRLELSSLSPQFYCDQQFD
jgi:hypothetical protein